MRNLYLDDMRTPPSGYDLVRSYDEFVAWIDENGVPDLVDFDHDLGDFDVDGNERTGVDCAKYLVMVCMDQKVGVPRFNVHSGNPGGAANIISFMNTARRVVGI